MKVLTNNWVRYLGAAATVYLGMVAEKKLASDDEFKDAAKKFQKNEKGDVDWARMPLGVGIALLDKDSRKQVWSLLAKAWVVVLPKKAPSLEK